MFESIPEWLLGNSAHVGIHLGLVLYPLTIPSAKTIASKVWQGHCKSGDM